MNTESSNVTTTTWLSKGSTLTNFESITLSMGECQRCNQEPATKDYNGHSYFVCYHCYKHLNDYFAEEYK